MERTRRGLGSSEVEIVEAGFLSYEHAGDRVDFVHSRNALHQIPDFWKGIALSRVRACLKDGGIRHRRHAYATYTCQAV